MRTAAVAGLLVCWYLPPAAAAASTPLPFDLTPEGAIIVSVSVNGTAAVPFLFDTGSTASMVSAELASRLALRPIARSTMVSGGAQQAVLVVGIEQVALGNVVARNLLATVAPRDALALPDLATAGRRVQGLLGQDVLSTLRYTVDYRRRTIVFRDRAEVPPAGAAVLALEACADRFVAVLPQDEGALRLVPDTGAAMIVLFGTGTGVGREGGSMGVTGLAGTQPARRATIGRLRIGPITWPDASAVVVTRPPESSPADGLLPMHAFARVTFNGPERQLVIESR
jgi:predicted aspartyl protease